MNEDKKNRDSELQLDEKKSKKAFRPIQVIIPALIGLIVVVWLFAGEFNSFQWSSIPFTSQTVLAIILAWCFMLGRDLGLSWRFRTITNKDLTWLQSFRVCMLCEFTSAITPTAVGGSSLGMVFMNREGINFGRATTLMLITLFLDELFFVISCPIIIAFTPIDVLFSSLSADFTSGVQWVFWGVYIVITIWTIILFLGIIVKPQFIRSILISLFRVKWLRKWEKGVAELGDNMVKASIEIRERKFRWWVQAFGATALSWTSRYMVVNALFWGFVVGADQWLVLARQFVVWLVLMISPTPGGSGLSEWLFTEYYADMVPTVGLALVIALIWRIISYYIYLIIGSFIVPSWLKGFKKK